MAEQDAAGGRCQQDADPSRTIKKPPTGGTLTAREAFLWVPRSAEGSSRNLLLALILDRPEGWPDNCSATARLLGVSRPTARAWRDALLADGLAELRAGRLIAGEQVEAWRRRQAEQLGVLRDDPLPRALLNRAGHLWPNAPKATRPASPALLIAAASLVGEALNRWSGRQYVRSDAERAELAGVSRSSIRLARELLERRGLATFEKIRRGRAELWRCKLLAAAAAGAPTAERRRQRLAELADRGRRRGGNYKNTPTKACGEYQKAAVETAAAKPLPRPPQRPPEPESFEGRVVRLLAGLAMRSRPRSTTPRARLRELLEPRAIAAIGRAAPRAACFQILAAVGAWSKQPRRAQEAAAILAGRHGRAAPALLLGVVADVLLAGPNIIDAGAIIAHRWPRLLSGNPASALSRCRAAWPVAKLIQAASTAAAAV